MDIKFSVELSAPPATASFALCIGFDGAEPRVLQDGYTDPQQALAALIDCLTLAPPDLESYDLGLTRLGTLVDEVTEITDAIGQIGSRLNDAEAKLEAVPLPAPAPKTNRLLPGREASAASASQSTAPARPAPGPIRRQIRTNSLPEEQRNLAGRVHGQNFGGPIRRGAGIEPAGVDTPNDGETE